MDAEGCVVDPAAHLNAHYRAVILNFAVNHLDAPMAECYEVARQECAANDPLHVQHLLPARSFQSAVSRARSAVEQPVPADLQQLIIPAALAHLNGDLFCLANETFDGPEQQEAMLVFGTARFVNLLRAANRVFVDGTFKTTPPPFAQIFSVHCLVGTRAVANVIAMFTLGT